MFNHLAEMKNFKFLQRQLMEQKMKQKWQTLGMVQASDRPGKPRTLELRPGSATSKGRELHGKLRFLTFGNCQ